MIKALLKKATSRFDMPASAFIDDLNTSLFIRLCAAILQHCRARFAQITRNVMKKSD